LKKTMPGLMKRLSKSAGDISPCKRKTRSNSFDEYQDELDQESPLDKCRTDVSEDEGDRPSSAQSSRSIVSVPAISVIGRDRSRRVKQKFPHRGRSRSEQSYRIRKPNRERSVAAAEIAAVPKSSHFGIFGILKHKLGLGSGRHKPNRSNDTSENIDDEGHEYMEEEVLESPLVARIRCEEGLDGDPGAPNVIRRKLSVSGIEPGVDRQESQQQECASPELSLVGATDTVQVAHTNSPTRDSRTSTPTPIPIRQDSKSSFMSVLTRSRTESSEDPPVSSNPITTTTGLQDLERQPSVEQQQAECFHSTEDLKLSNTTLYRLVIHLKAGHDLSIKDSCGTSDPYVKFFHDGKMVFKSKTVYKDLNPFWDETFDLILEDISVPLDLKVYDYDWGLRDDFMGQAQIVLREAHIGREEDMILTLVETGQAQYLGQVSITIKLNPVLPDTPEHRRVSQAASIITSSARQLELAARKLGRAGWSSVVTVFLVEGRDLLAMDEEGTSDPYCKFRLGNERFKTKTVYQSLNPRWQEQFELYLYDDQSLELDITVWDKDQRSKDDFMGRGSIDLSKLQREVSHQIWLNLEDGAGKLFLIVTISGTTSHDCETFLSNWDHSQFAVDQRSKKYSVRNSFRKFENVGSLVVKVYRAKGLYAADLGGSSDPFCVLELDNTRVQTHTEYKTLDPVWQKVFVLPVPDVHSILFISVFDEDKNHKTEFLGKLSVPLLGMKNNEKKWWALKDKTLRTRAKGTFPQIQLEFELFWSPLMATYVTLNPKKEIYTKTDDKFKRQVFVNNVMRIKEVILSIMDFVGFIKSCLEWEDVPRSLIAFVIFMTVTYYFEPYMAPIGLLLFFLKYFIVTRYFVQKHQVDNVSDINISDDEDDEEKEEDKEEKKSFKEKLQAVQEVTAMVQNALGYAAHFCEAVKNTFNFSVPFLSWLAIIILTIVSIFLFFIPCRVIIMLWGINKFSRQLIMPNTVPNNELLDFLSRVPNDVMLKDSRELKLMHEESAHKRPTNKRRS